MESAASHPAAFSSRMPQEENELFFSTELAPEPVGDVPGPVTSDNHALASNFDHAAYDYVHRQSPTLDSAEQSTRIDTERPTHSPSSAIQGQTTSEKRAPQPKQRRVATWKTSQEEDHAAQLKAMSPLMSIHQIHKGDDRDEVESANRHTDVDSERKGKHTIAKVEGVDDFDDHVDTRALPSP